MLDWHVYLLTDLRGIAKGDGEEKGGNGQGQDEDVGEALHGEFSVGEDEVRVSADRLS